MPVRIARRHLDLDLRRVSYLDASNGKPESTVVFLHAFPLHAGMWAAQLEAVPAGWRAIAPDFRGFGLSDPDPESRDAEETLGDFAADVARMLDHLKIPRAAFCGLSMGGYTLLALLRDHPGRISGMVLADTRATADTDAGRASRVAMLDRLEKSGPAAIAADMLPGLLGDTSRRDRPAIVQDVTRMLGAATSAGIGPAIRRMMRRLDSTDLLPGVACPTLVIVGQEDLLTPVAASRSIQEAIPGSSLKIIEGAGHLSNLERPDAFNQALWSFLQTSSFELTS